MKTILTIAGSDSCGGAGIQADIKAISALGGYACSAITALTAQNTTKVAMSEGVSPLMLRSQIEAVFDDLNVDAVKTGMLFDTPQIETVADCLEKYRPKFVVVDPVMISTSGSRLLADKAIETVKKRIFPLASVITPNISEAETLTGMKITCLNDMLSAARALQAEGCSAVIVKGGHLKDEKGASTDLLLDSDGTAHYEHSPWVESKNTHGTGCTFSSALATLLAQGADMPLAFAKAKEYIYNAIVAGKNLNIGHGHGPVHHFYKQQNLS